MPAVGFKPTISVLERAKAVHALDRAVTAIGKINLGEIRWGGVDLIGVAQDKDKR
jgi:hypothetical protein